MGDLPSDGLALIGGVYHLTYQGLTLSLSSWAQKRGMSQGMLKERARAGWPVAQALGYEERVRPEIDYEARRGAGNSHATAERNRWRNGLRSES